ncbi:hypothetical protein QVD17_00881 [Tagetes erecta]|uniref:Uncharacterized protein n=1 Tax=Tagetes erecta TaxID=13708 RepID=A0AAD8P7T7_TARER|nr:hypothetical protein QVD17_00881 [Tagetes erecta]
MKDLHSLIQILMGSKEWNGMERNGTELMIENCTTQGYNYFSCYILVLGREMHALTSVQTLSLHSKNKNCCNTNFSDLGKLRTLISISNHTLHQIRRYLLQSSTYTYFITITKCSCSNRRQIFSLQNCYQLTRLSSLISKF